MKRKKLALRGVMGRNSDYIQEVTERHFVTNAMIKKYGEHQSILKLDTNVQ